VQRRQAERTARIAEVALATDADLVWAFDPDFDGVTPRELLEQLVAGCPVAFWRLRRTSLSPELYEIAVALDGPDMAELAIAQVVEQLRALLEDDAPIPPVALETMAWLLNMAARELAA